MHDQGFDDFKFGDAEDLRGMGGAALVDVGEAVGDEVDLAFTEEAQCGGVWELRHKRKGLGL